MTLAVAPVAATASRDRVEHRQAEMGRAALPRRHAADHLRAVGERLLRMERAGLAGHALGDDLGIRLTRMDIYCSPEASGFNRQRSGATPRSRRRMGEAFGESNNRPLVGPIAAPGLLTCRRGSASRCAPYESQGRRSISADRRMPRASMPDPGIVDRFPIDRSADKRSNFPAPLFSPSLVATLKQSWL